MYRRATVLFACCTLASCFSGGSTDNLRGEISPTGTALALQVNLANGSNQASAVASIYIDEEKKALVGGDFFTAYTDQENSRLYAVENLSGNYKGDVGVQPGNPVVTIETKYDPEMAREDRWYPVDELLVDPGPNEALVGYSQEFIIPQPLTGLTINNDEFNNRNDSVVLNWDAGDGDQMTFNAIVSCTDGQSDFVYSRFYVLPDGANADDGEYTLPVGEIIDNEFSIDLLATLQRELSTIVAYVVLEYATAGLVKVSDLVNANQSVDVFSMESCKVDLTLFREVGESLPEGVSSGFAISSSSDSTSFTYRKEAM
ncbi:MAG: hypothetical protein CSA49_06370 [Gammaproteobacteria bacterium]|nr:MAG: hypothetical protein CSA49_06370 [Gammaproteobacteria bacterium]